MAMLLPLMLAGCYQDFSPTTDTTPVLCLNSIITAGEPIEVDVTRTWTFNDPSGARDHKVDDATVTVYANGEPQSASYIPAEGDEIRIVAESPKYGSAEATVTVPVAVPVTVRKFNGVVTDLWRHYDDYMAADLDFDLYVTLDVKDLPGDDNYFKLDYNWSYLSDDEPDYVEPGVSRPLQIYFSLGALDYEAEPIFQEHIGAFESIMGSDDTMGLVFTDRQFSGKTYPLHLKFRNSHYRVNSQSYDESFYDCSLTFMLASVSQSYYNRAIYVWQRDSGVLGDLGDLGFADPMWGYSNVSTGAGVVAARSYSTCTLDLHDFLKESIENPE